MKTVYIASDGTKFSNRKNCKIHEELFNPNKRILKNIEMYDKNLKPLSEKDKYFYNIIRIINFKNKKEIQAFNTYFHKAPFPKIKETGIYISVKTKNKFYFYNINDTNTYPNFLKTFFFAKNLKNQTNIEE